MALLANSITIEVLIWVTAIFIMDGGLIRNVISMGLYITNIGIITGSQNYISDLTTPPANVAIPFAPLLLNGWALVNALLALVAFAYAFKNYSKIIQIRQNSVKDVLKTIIEEDLLI